MLKRLLAPLIAAVALAACATPPVGGAGAPALAPPPAAASARPVLDEDLTRFSFTDDINPADARGRFAVTGRGPDDRPVFTAENRKMSVNGNGIRAQWKTAQAIRKGDVLYGRVSLRALQARQESGEAEGLLYFVPLAGGADRVAMGFSVGPDWVTVLFPFVAPYDVAPGAAALHLSFGNLVQTLEVANVELLNYGRALDVGALPITRFSYAGREPGARWREEALARIEKLRTSPVTVKVLGPDGAPLPGARVEVAMQRPAFLWGSEVSAKRSFDGSADAERYRAEFLRLFDTATIGDGLKWPTWATPQGRAQALATIDWLHGQGVRVKGHTLVWPAWKFSPGFVSASPEAKARIGETVQAHIADILAATRGKLIGWDVVNEPLHETDYFQHVPRERVVDWFRQAEQAEPQQQLTLNEYAMLNRSTSPLFIKDFKAFAQEMKARGARIDVLGVQGHVGQIPRAPAAVLADLDLLAEGGWQVQITEFDMNTKDEQLQADYLRDFLIALYSHPAASGFIMWGFWEGQHWKPDAALFRRDWSEKPVAQVWRDWVRGAWRTHLQATTAADGQVSTRAHHGRYRVTATHAGRTLTQEVDVGPATRQALTLQLR